MSPEMVGISGIIFLLLVLFCLGMPVGFGMAVVGFCGYWYKVSFNAAISMVGADIWSTFSSYGLTVVPLYIFMGYLAFNSGIAERLYTAAYKWVGHWPGGLAIATIGADELFAAICGSNTATAATMGTVALPQMKKYNYDPRLSAGTVATGGTLGVVMPPSVVLIIIGLQTQQSIADLFLAGILPALLLGLLFVLTILTLCRVRPEFGPPGPRTTFREKMASIPGIMEALAVFILVIGGLYAGIFTPTEAGSFGVLATFMVSVVTGKFTMKGLVSALKDTLWISCMCFFLITGATIFGRFLAVTRLPFAVADFAAQLPVSPYIILAVILLIYIIGGCIMDALGFLVITIPIFFPLGEALGFEPLWFSIILTMVTTLGAITPPVGVNIYVVKALAPDVRLGDIFKSVSFFVMASVAAMIILTIFPGIALILPGLLHR
ncbi:MAG: C4-dicarboxylate ABC transporter permease [Deltaproteobacteria bacterium HGW-Deltaproteobacteria-21]|nr:MAG: C4-dicarboxylate ABC transporter permease [Deltaproteobacteria bacterium HGW-Deltaproteobacteria-21]